MDLTQEQADRIQELADEFNIDYCIVCDLVELLGINELEDGVVNALQDLETNWSI